MHNLRRISLDVEVNKAKKTRIINIQEGVGSGACTSSTDSRLTDAKARSHASSRLLFAHVNTHIGARAHTHEQKE